MEDKTMLGEFLEPVADQQEIVTEGVYDLDSKIEDIPAEDKQALRMKAYLESTYVTEATIKDGDKVKPVKVNLGAIINVETVVVQVGSFVFVLNENQARAVQHALRKECDRISTARFEAISKARKAKKNAKGVRLHN